MSDQRAGKQTWLTLGEAARAGSGIAMATFCRSKSVVDSYSMLT